MVICQPYVQLNTEEPFRWRNAGAKAAQLEVISNTLEIARSNPHGLDRTHFTIFPEYSICGLDGVTRITEALTDDNWPRRTIVIGGVDGLSKQEFTALCGLATTDVDEALHSPAQVEDHEWVNCQITWIKTEAGVVKKWIQPKIEAAKPEQDGTCQQMFRGRSVYNFVGRFENAGPFRFSSLICFDWIGNVDGNKIWKCVLDGLQVEAHNANVQYPLSWFFVLQYNKNPSHNTFLAEIAPFFQQNSAPNIQRAATCLVFANCAGKEKPGIVGNFGHTSLIFCPQAPLNRPTCSPTYSNGGMRFRNSDVLTGYYDVFFREGGACIYSFAQTNPADAMYGPGRTFPVLEPKVFSVDGNQDKRTPSQPVPASVKWVNDTLDSLSRLSTLHPGRPAAAPSNGTHDHNILGLREESGRKLEHGLDLATCRLKPGENECPPPLIADEWDTSQLKALENLVHSLNIVSLGSPPAMFSQQDAHATITLNGEPFDFVAVDGINHEDCVKQFDKKLPTPKRKTLLVTRDYHNTECSKKERSILDVEPRRPGGDGRFDDLTQNVFHTGFDNLLTIFREANNTDEIPGALNGILNT